MLCFYFLFSVPSSIFFCLTLYVPLWYVLLFLYITLMIWYPFPWCYFYCAYLCMKYSPGISNFLEEISRHSHSIIFLYFFALITEATFLISPCYSLQFHIQMDISFLFSSVFGFSFLHQIFTRPPPKTICLFPFLLGLVLITASCTISQTSFHSSSSTLWELIPWMYLSFSQYILKEFYLSHT